MRCAVAVLSTLLLVGGCSVDTDLRFAGSSPPTEVVGSSPDPAALPVWDGFPAGAHPRPLVLEQLPAVPGKDLLDGAVGSAIDALYPVHLVRPLGGRVLLQAAGAGPPPVVRVVSGAAG